MGHRPRSGWQCGGELDLLGPGGLPRGGAGGLRCWLWLRSSGRPSRSSCSAKFGPRPPKGAILTPRAGFVPTSLSRTTGGPAWMKRRSPDSLTNREGPYHLYDSHNRPLIRAETGKWVLAALLDDQDQLIFLDDPGCRESSVLKKTFWAREWLSDPVFPNPCSCGDGRCKGRLVITLRDSYAGPNWKLTFRG